jgi:hypothetical protein
VRKWYKIHYKFLLYLKSAKIPHCVACFMQAVTFHILCTPAILGQIWTSHYQPIVILYVTHNLPTGVPGRPGHFRTTQFNKQDPVTVCMCTVNVAVFNTVDGYFGRIASEAHGVVAACQQHHKTDISSWHNLATAGRTSDQKIAVNVVTLLSVRVHKS